MSSTALDKLDTSDYKPVDLNPHSNSAQKNVFTEDLLQSTRFTSDKFNKIAL